MTMSTEREVAITDEVLDQLFSAARRAPSPPPEALMARVLADAAREQGARPARAELRPARGWLAGLLAGLGGPGALAGLATAGLAGVWIGFVQPLDLSLVGAAAAAETLDLYPADLEALSDVLAPDLNTEG